jgi:TetR/AcrR family transcriptional regulator, fatty acid metabolism regulator protein
MSLTDRSIGTAERQRQILEAAVRVFARNGYHTSRVADVAAEAGVAHGLVYHYFPSKAALLEAVFQETWQGLLEELRRLEGSGDTAREQLRKVAAIVLRTWRRDPDLIRVLVREVARSPQLQDQAEAVGDVLGVIERIVARGQDAGELRSDLDPRLSAWIVWGALEELLTGWVLERLPDSDADVTAAERTVVELLATGLVSPRRTD